MRPLRLLAAALLASALAGCCNVPCDPCCPACPPLPPKAAAPQEESHFGATTEAAPSKAQPLEAPPPGAPRDENEPLENAPPK
jgi:hypothetical protein